MFNYQLCEVDDALSNKLYMKHVYNSYVPVMVTQKCHFAVSAHKTEFSLIEVLCKVIFLLNIV